MIALDDVRAAARALEGVAVRTPTLTADALDAATGARVLVKAECFQRGGAFKLRGAYHKIASLGEAERARGVVAFSSGNHAQAVALAASLLGTTAVIVMPEDAPPVKVEATRGHGAEIVPYDRYTQDRERVAAELAEQRGLTLVPPFDDPLVMAGQGTVALELLEDAGPVDVLLAPVGGGGLIAGCATVARALAPGARVLGVEPAARDVTRRSLAAGERLRAPVPQTIADGQQVEAPGARTFEVNRERVDDVLLATDEQLVRAMAFLFDHVKAVSEPSGASAVAALLAGAADVAGRRVGVVLSGGNVGLERFCELTGARA